MKPDNYNGNGEKPRNKAGKPDIPEQWWEKAFIPVIEQLTRIEEKIEVIPEMNKRLDEVAGKVRDIQTKEEALKEYKEEETEKTKNRRDHIFKIIIASGSIISAIILILGIFKVFD